MAIAPTAAKATRRNPRRGRGAAVDESMLFNMDFRFDDDMTWPGS
ncbi:MAG: hypothetical protein R2698_06310 [Microthrixaceae bacterium]